MGNKKNRRTGLTTILVAVAALIILYNSILIVREGQQVLVLRFGKPVRVINTDNKSAGLYFRIPAIDTPQFYPNKIQAWDGEPRMLPTSDDKRILVDVTARWRITSPQTFYTSLSDTSQAYNKMDNIIDSRVRSIIGKYRMNDAVRTTNVILTDYSNYIETNTSTTTEETPAESDDFNIDWINQGRLNLAEETLELSRIDINPETFGMELVDVDIRQVQYPDNVAEKAFQRMVTERKREAAFKRSQGEKEKAKIMGDLERDKRTALAKGEAKAAAIYREAYTQAGAAEFYRFWRAMESYKDNLGDVKKTLSTNMAYFDYLYSSSGQR